MLVAVHDARRTRQQRMQLALRPGRGACLEGTAAREHDRDDRTRQVLADDERADEREHRQRVDTQTPVPGRVDHPPTRGRDPDDRVGRPHRMRGVVRAREVQDAAAGEQRDGDNQQDRLGMCAQGNRTGPDGLLGRVREPGSTRRAVGQRPHTASSSSAPRADARLLPSIGPDPTPDTTEAKDPPAPQFVVTAYPESQNSAPGCPSSPGVGGGETLLCAPIGSGSATRRWAQIWRAQLPGVLRHKATTAGVAPPKRGPSRNGCGRPRLYRNQASANMIKVVRR